MSKQIFSKHTQIFENNFVINDLKNIFNLYNIFIPTFNKWKEQDKYVILDELIKIYFETEELEYITNKNKEYNKIVINEAQNEKNKIIYKIKLVGGDKGIKYFEKQKKILDLYKKEYEKLLNNIKTNMHNAYWDIIKEKLAQNPPDTTIILELLTNIQTLLCYCVPNRSDIHIKIVQDIDIDYIDSLIKNNTIDDKEIINYTYKIINWINKFNASNDNSFIQWKKNFDKKYENYGVNYFERFIPIDE